MNEIEFAGRINQLIESLKMNKKSFAKSIGVSQAVITHLTSGRNNPSLEMIQKILLTYPQIDCEWVVLGKGEMYKQSSKNWEEEKKRNDKLVQTDQLIVKANQSLYEAIKNIRDLQSTS